MEHFFATCPRGLEAQLAGELDMAGAVRIEAVAGGVGFAGSWGSCYRANLRSRIATRILWRVAHGPYQREEDIYRLAHEVPWHKQFAVRRTLRVYMTAIRCPLKSIDFVTLRIKDAVCDRFRFVLEPLAEILPELVHPGLGRSVAELLRSCADTSRVARFAGARA